MSIIFGVYKSRDKTNSEAMAQSWSGGGDSGVRGTHNNFHYNTCKSFIDSIWDCRYFYYLEPLRVFMYKRLGINYMYYSICKINMGFINFVVIYEDPRKEYSTVLK